MRTTFTLAAAALLALSASAFAQSTDNAGSTPGHTGVDGGMSTPPAGAKTKEGRASANDSGGAIKPGRNGESNGNNNTGSNGQ